MTTVAEPGRRNRRTGDAVFLAAAALPAGATAVVGLSEAFAERRETPREVTDGAAGGWT